MAHLDMQNAQVAVDVCKITPVSRDIGEFGYERFEKRDCPSNRLLRLHEPTPLAEPKAKQVITVCKISSIIRELGKLGHKRLSKFQGTAGGALRFHYLT